VGLAPLLGVALGVGEHAQEGQGPCSLSLWERHEEHHMYACRKPLIFGRALGSVLVGCLMLPLVGGFSGSFKAPLVKSVSTSDQEGDSVAEAEKRTGEVILKPRLKSLNSTILSVNYG
jgi:hypothetical protein